MHVRGGQFVAQDEEAVYLNGGVRLNPVLVRTVRVWRLAPSALATGIAGRIGRDDYVSFRQTLHEEQEEPFQQRCPASAGHRPAEHGMVRYAVYTEVPAQHAQQTFRIAEGRTE